MATPTKVGYLNKQGGGEGGHKNWKKRFFVLDNPEGKLDYFADEGAYQKGKPPLGTLKLDIYKAKAEFVEEGKKSGFEFSILAYPKSMTLRGADEEDMLSWLNTLQNPIDETIASSTLYEDALSDLKIADDAPIPGLKRRGLC